MQNVARWGAAFFMALLCYDLYRDSAALLSFPDGESILAVAVLLMVFVLLGLLLFPYLRVRSIFRKSPGLNKPRYYAFSAQGLTVETEDAKSECRWSVFQRVVETRAVFVFSLTSFGAVYVPKRCFASQQDIPRVRTLIRANMPGKYKLRGE